MGCDIHAHIEVKLSGRWEHYSIPRISRRYALFGRMAGVRDSSIEPIALPRGIPKNATRLTKFDCKQWGVDGHSHSWLNAEELAALVEWYDNLRRGEDRNWIATWEHYELGYLFGNGWNWKKYRSDYPKQLEDTRIIFWFDN